MFCRFSRWFPLELCVGDLGTRGHTCRALPCGRACVGAERTAWWLANSSTHGRVVEARKRLEDERRGLDLMAVELKDIASDRPVLVERIKKLTLRAEAEKEPLLKEEKAVKDTKLHQSLLQRELDALEKVQQEKPSTATQNAIRAFRAKLRNCELFLASDKVGVGVPCARACLPCLP